MSLGAIADSFMRWTDKYALVCAGMLKSHLLKTTELCSLYYYNYDISGLVNCHGCALAKYDMKCTSVSGTSYWWEVMSGLCDGKQPRKAVEHMAIALLLAYYAEGGRKEW